MRTLIAGRIAILAVFAAVSAFSQTAERKIVIQSLDEHYDWAITPERLQDYRAASQDVRIVVARTPQEFEREIVDADD